MTATVRADLEAALSAAPAGEETEQSIKADAYDMIAEALERAGLAGSSIVESVARLIAAPVGYDDGTGRVRDWTAAAPTPDELSDMRQFIANRANDWDRFRDRQQQARELAQQEGGRHG